MKKGELYTYYYCTLYYYYYCLAVLIVLGCAAVGVYTRLSGLLRYCCMLSAVRATKITIIGTVINRNHDP